MTKPRTLEDIREWLGEQACRCLEQDEPWFRSDCDVCVLAALREAADAARREERNRAWLIELPRSNGSPLWYGKRPGFEGWWVEDANHAIRFARREDAEQARLYLHDGHLARVSDHVWLDARSRAEEPEP